MKVKKFIFCIPCIHSRDLTKLGILQDWKHFKTRTENVSKVRYTTWKCLWFWNQKNSKPVLRFLNKLPIEKLNSRFTLTQAKSVNVDLSAPWCNLWRNEIHVSSDNKSKPTSGAKSIYLSDALFICKIILVFID